MGGGGKETPKILPQSQPSMPLTPHVSHGLPTHLLYDSSPCSLHTSIPTGRPLYHSPALDRVAPGTAGLRAILVILPLSTFIPAGFFL